ncbi:hypothetical protein ACX12L_12710 [Alicycliphilus sp. T452]
MHERRSGMHAGAQLDWVEEATGQGVGARQGGEAARPGGGGYLDECTPAQLWEKARFRELADMGLPQVWLEIAHDLGYEAFMRLWRRLDAVTAMRSDNNSMIEVKLRRFGSFQRYQRNRFIETLAGMGLSNPAIRDRVKRDLGEDLSESHILRLAGRRRVRA